jgi:predicted HTH transcriptional regulator
MNLRELEELVRKGEGQRLEFKLKAAYPEKIVREMVAFANSGGGQLFVGVDDDGKIPGCKFAEEERYAIEKALSSHTKPKINYRFEFIPINRKRSVLHYNIFETRRKPIYYLHDPSKRGKAFVRVDDKSMQASKEMVEILKRSKNKKSYPISLNTSARLLFQYLDTHGKITLEDFVDLTQLTRNRASQMLVNLVISNILNIEVGDRMDFYSMKNAGSKN